MQSAILPILSFSAGAAVLAGLLVPTWAPVLLLIFALGAGATVLIWKKTDANSQATPDPSSPSKYSWNSR